MLNLIRIDIIIRLVHHNNMQDTQQQEEMPRVTNMKIVERFPPIIDKIVAALGDYPEAKPIYCYGDTIYNPYKRIITPDIEIHEQVHSRQQGDYPDVWIEQYLTDPEFRLQAEIEAYGTQYLYAKEHGVRGNMLQWLKEKLATELSGETYGNLVSYHKAESLIRHFTIEG